MGKWRDSSAPTLSFFLIQPSVTSTLNSKSFHKLSRSHRATSQIFVFVSLFINLAGRHIQKLDGPRLLRSQRLPLISRKSGKLNAVRWDPSERGLLQNVSPWLKHYDFKVRRIAGNLKGIRVESWGNWATVTKLTERHLQVSTRKVICMRENKYLSEVWQNALQAWLKEKQENLSEIASLTSLLLPMEVCFILQLVSLSKIQFSVYVSLCVRVSHYT